MFKKKFLKFVTTLTCIAALILPHTSVVLAAALTNENPNDVNEVELTSTEYRENGYMYTFGGRRGHTSAKNSKKSFKWFLFI